MWCVYQRVAYVVYRMWCAYQRVAYVVCLPEGSVCGVLTRG